MKAPIVIDNFISQAECQALIAMAAQHRKQHSSIQSTMVRDWKHVSDIVADEGTELQDCLQRIHRDVGDRIVTEYECYRAWPRDVGYFYEYGMGDYYRPHVDSQTVSTINGVTTGVRKASSSDVSSVLYLNDSFIGGEIDFMLAGFKVKPKAGRLLLFYGGWENLHCVHPIQIGKRYCIVNWYETKKKLVPTLEAIPEQYAPYFAQLEAEYQAMRS